MGVNLTKDSIDLGIVTTNTEAMIGFYRACWASPTTARCRCRRHDAPAAVWEQLYQAGIAIT